MEPLVSSTPCAVPPVWHAKARNGKGRKSFHSGVLSPTTCIIATVLVVAAIFLAEMLWTADPDGADGVMNGTVCRAAQHLVPERVDNCDDFYLAWLYGGYALAGLLTLAYFIESAPCHNSQELEATYITFVMGLVVVVTAGFSTHRTAFTMRSWFFMVAFVAYRLTRTVAAPRVLSSFFDSSRDMPAMMRESASNPLASRASTQIAMLIAEILKLESGSFMMIPEAVMDSILLLMLLVFIVTLAHVGTAAIAWREDHGPDAFIVVFALLICLYETRVKVCSSQRKKELFDIVDNLLIEVKQMGHKLQQETITKVLCGISVGSFMEVASHNTVTLLTNMALEQDLLDVLSKAVIIDGLQKRGLRYQKRRQELIRDLFVDTTGEDLSKLKSLTDFGGDIFNLYRLLYYDMTHAALRDEIIEHFQAEGAELREKNLGKSIGIKVLSDIDDTLYSSGGHFPAGCDSSYPQHVVYPGVLALFRELDRSFRKGELSCNLAFLSARPHIYKSVTEEHSYQLFQALVNEERMHSLPTLLPGRLASGAWAAVSHWHLGTRAWRAVGEDKYKSFLDFAALHSEYDFVFCGDNGQGDLLAGQRMMGLGGARGDAGRQGNFSPPNVLCVLIHEVLPDSEALALDRAPQGRGSGGPRAPDAEWRLTLEEKNIFFHRSYAGAALAIHRRLPHLVSLDQLHAVAMSSIDGLLFALDMYSSHDWTEAARNCHEDVRQIAVRLRESGRLTLDVEAGMQNLLRVLEMRQSTTGSNIDDTTSSDDGSS